MTTAFAPTLAVEPIMLTPIGRVETSHRMVTDPTDYEHEHVYERQ
jgi:hypothetical protein